jgi:hypothetical protein
VRFELARRDYSPHARFSRAVASSRQKGGAQLGPTLQQESAEWMVERTVMSVGDSEGGKGVVMAIRARHRAQGMCSCGWVGRPRLWLSSAKVDALVHAASHGCQAAIPLVQPETVDTLNTPGDLTVFCPAGCGACLSVPMLITDTLSARSHDGELCVRFTAEAPELYDYINKHLQTCPAATSSADAALERTHT